MNQNKSSKLKVKKSCEKISKTNKRSDTEGVPKPWAMDQYQATAC